MARSLTALAPIGLAAAFLLGAAPRSSAQSSISVHADAADSVSWIVPRQPLGVASATVRTTDRTVAVLLMDSTLVLQLTDRGLDRMSDDVAHEPTTSTGGRFLARMIGAALTGMFDHGIAYRLSALRSVRVEGSRLVFEDLGGRRVFDQVEMNGRQVMDDFSPAEAERFAAAVNRAIRERR
jgi:hypothetical protein